MNYEVCDRTIRRDLAALESAGFPLYTHRVGNRNCWRLSSKPFKALSETAFTLSELCAFYINRVRLAAVAGSPIDGDLRSAIDKVSKALGPHMKSMSRSEAGSLDLDKVEHAEIRAIRDQGGVSGASSSTPGDRTGRSQS
jgi:predicted DNA-binding transcriptional regulator YafY